MFHNLLNGADLHAPTNYVVENNTGTNIPALTVVTYVGIGTSFPSIRPKASPGDRVRGVTMQSIGPVTGSNVGFVTSLGFLINVDTSAWPVGTLLYSDSSGNLTTAATGPVVATVYKQDVAYGQLFIEGSASGSGGGGSGDVVGPFTSTDKAIARYNGVTGTVVQDSPYSIVQDGGGIQAQAFVFNRQILHDVNVPNKYTIMSTDLELVTGDIILNGDSQLILI
jgi:hypothetical protein